MNDPQGDDPGWDVFFSYDRADEARARRIAAALSERRLRVWIDSGEIEATERWAEEIETGLRSSRVYAMMVTQRALESRWVMDEYYAALALGNSEGRPKIVPVIAENVPLPVFMSIRQWIDYRAEEKFENVLQELERCARAGKAEEDRAPQAPAPASAPRSAVSDAQLAYLERALAQGRGKLRDVRVIRGVGVVLGILVALLLLSIAAPGGLVVPVGGALSVWLVAWAASESGRAAAARRENRLLFVRDRLQECRSQYDASCEQALAEFWRLVHGDAGAGVAQEVGHGK
jgi:hypothetical protein